MGHLFQDDGLRLNETGYRVWNKVVTQWLATKVSERPLRE